MRRASASPSRLRRSFTAAAAFSWRSRRPMKSSPPARSSAATRLRSARSSASRPSSLSSSKPAPCGASPRWKRAMSACSSAASLRNCSAWRSRARFMKSIEPSSLRALRSLARLSSPSASSRPSGSESASAAPPHNTDDTGALPLSSSSTRRSCSSSEDSASAASMSSSSAASSALAMSRCRSTSCSRMASLASSSNLAMCLTWRTHLLVFLCRCVVRSSARILSIFACAFLRAASGLTSSSARSLSSRSRSFSLRRMRRYAFDLILLKRLRFARS
mmetsp:Transcript_34059/g.105187  ORF Transcript_34059/g.105187 Transcript_34059/m.105187 type:complete len:276 (-) Transcript_34059:1276-2103(-)